MQRVLGVKRIVLVFSFSSPYICLLGRFPSPFFLPRSSLSLLKNIPFSSRSSSLSWKLDIYLLISRYLPPSPSKIHRHSIGGLDFEWNRKWVLGRVLGLFGPFTDFKRFYNFSESAHLDTTSIRRVSSHFSYSLDDRDVKLTVAVYTITMDFNQEYKSLRFLL